MGTGGRKIHNYQQYSCSPSLKTKNEAHLRLSSLEDFGLVAFLDQIVYNRYIDGRFHYAEV